MFGTNSLAIRAVPGIGTGRPMTAPHAIARAPAPVTDTVIQRSDAGARTRLAVSGGASSGACSPTGGRSSRSATRPGS
jgi:hypothetical protein